MESPPSNTGLSMWLRTASAISAVEQLERLGDFQSITITLQATSEGYCVEDAILSLEDFGMTLTPSSEGVTIFVPLPRSTSSER